MRGAFVAQNLFASAIRTLADSIVFYHASSSRRGAYRFYPSAILSTWGAFEFFVRHTSELLILTADALPQPVALFLREEVPQLGRQGAVVLGLKTSSVVARYEVLLRHGFNFSVDHGCRHWQGLRDARNLRNRFAHLDTSERHEILTDDVFRYIESVLVAIIWPSAMLRRTLLPGVFHFHSQLRDLRRLALPFSERPMLVDFATDEDVHFYNPFENICGERFPVAR